MNDELRVVWENDSLRVAIHEGTYDRVFHVFKRKVDAFGQGHWIEYGMLVSKFSTPKKFHWVCDLLEAMFPKKQDEISE